MVRALITYQSVMSTALGGNTKEILFSQSITYVAVVLIAVLYLWSMKKFFGTFFMRTAFGNYQNNKVIQKKYHEMFASRDNLMYHISWAKTRGELDEAKRLMKQLESVDQVRCCSLASCLKYLDVVPF